VLIARAYPCRPSFGRPLAEPPALASPPDSAYSAAWRFVNNGRRVLTPGSVLYWAAPARLEGG